MKGFIRPRGDAWELRVFLGTDPVTNKKRYASKTVHGGKRDAQRSLNEMITQAERGLSAPTTATVGELIERWFEFAAQDFSPSTVKETRGFIDRNLLPTLGAVPLGRLKASDLDRFYRKLSASLGSGGRAGSASSDSLVAGAGVLVDAVRRDGSETLRDHRPSMARCRSRQPNGRHPPRRRRRAGRTRREGHQDARCTTSLARRPDRLGAHRSPQPNGHQRDGVQAHARRERVRVQ